MSAEMGKEPPSFEFGIKDPLSLDETELQNISNLYLAVVHLRHGCVYNISSLVGVLIGQATSDKGTGARKDSGRAYEGTVCRTATAGGLSEP